MLDFKSWLKVTDYRVHKGKKVNSQVIYLLTANSPKRVKST